MDDTLTPILAAAGLAGATGHRAFLPAFALGLWHRIAAASAGAGEAPSFALSQKFEWLGDPTVLAIVGVLALVEFVAERNPDAPELVNLALKVPKAAGGFLVAAAAVGTVDDNVGLLAASGLLGSGISLGVDKMRADVKHAVQEPLSDATGGGSDKALGWLETAWAGFLTVASWLLPLLAALGIATVAAVWFLRRRAEQASRVPCPHCGHLRLPAARVCPGCRRDLTAPAALAQAPSSGRPDSAPSAELPPTV
jgi:hypothetical protein